MLKKGLRLQILILMLFFSVPLIIPNAVSIAHAKTTTLKELKKIRRQSDKSRENGGPKMYDELYKCKGNVIRWDSFLAHAKTSYMTYYKLKKDGQTLKLICDIEVKAYFDEKADMYKAKYKIKKAGSSKYVKLSNKKFKKLEKKYKIIKAI